MQYPKQQRPEIRSCNIALKRKSRRALAHISDSDIYAVTGDTYAFLCKWLTLNASRTAELPAVKGADTPGHL